MPGRTMLVYAVLMENPCTRLLSTAVLRDAAQQVNVNWPRRYVRELVDHGASRVIPRGKTILLGVSSAALVYRRHLLFW